MRADGDLPGDFLSTDRVAALSSTGRDHSFILLEALIRIGWVRALSARLNHLRNVALPIRIGFRA